MEFLKDVLGEALYAQVEAALKGNDKIKLANLADGQYIDKNKFTALDKEKKALEAQLGERDSEIEELKKVDAAALQGENKKLQDQITLIGKGIPADKVAKYQTLAASYMTDNVDFGAAADLALKDFPIAKDTGVPGAGGNPVPPENDTKPGTFREAIQESLQ